MRVYVDVFKLDILCKRRQQRLCNTSSKGVRIIRDDVAYADVRLIMHGPPRMVFVRAPPP